MRNQHNSYTIEDLEQIWNKWTDVVTPPEIEKTCFKFMEPLKNSISNLVELNPQQKNILSHDPYKIGLRTGELLSQFSRLSFMVGLEFGILDKYSSRTDDYVSENAKKAMPLLKIASDPVQKIVMELLGVLVLSKVYDEQTTLKKGQEIGKVIVYCSIQCFRLGLNYSTWI